MLALPSLAAQEQSRLEVGISLRSWRNLEGRVCAGASGTPPQRFWARFTCSRSQQCFIQ